MPIISGGGAAFNGGTITAPLVIQTNDSSPLLIETALGVKELLIGLGVGGTLLTNDPDGAGAPSVRMLSDGLHLYSEAFRLLVDLVGSDLQLGRGGGVTIRYDAGSGSGQFILENTSAPADATINNGECALWFDKTAAATKLMVKAKDEAGTYKTAAIALA